MKRLIALYAVAVLAFCGQASVTGKLSDSVSIKNPITTKIFSTGGKTYTLTVSDSIGDTASPRFVIHELNKGKLSEVSNTPFSQLGEIAISGTDLYSYNYDFCQISLKDPQNPKQTGYLNSDSFSTYSSRISSITAQGSVCYAVALMLIVEQPSPLVDPVIKRTWNLFRADFTDPNKPKASKVVLSSDDAFYGNVIVDNGYAYVNGTKSIHIVSLKDVMTLESTFTLTPAFDTHFKNNLQKSGDYLYFYDYTLGPRAFRSVDISNPKAPVSRGSCKTSALIYSMAPIEIGGCPFIASTVLGMPDDFVAFFNVKTPGGPVADSGALVGDIYSDAGMNMVDSFLVVSFKPGLKVYQMHYTAPVVQTLSRMPSIVQKFPRQVPQVLFKKEKQGLDMTGRKIRASKTAQILIQ